ncbi:MAG: pilin [Endozoicomonadaceae bacterium]|nr:pilin [Endozoicomonadaceae bacterium]
MKMSHASKGFSLIELMIVVTIVSILASVSARSYYFYTKRTHVTEGLGLASAVQKSSVEYYSVLGSWPTSNTLAGVSENIQGHSVSSVVITADGYILVTYNDKVTLGAQILFKPQVEEGKQRIYWTCEAVVGTGMKDSFLPGSCR